MRERVCGDGGSRGEVLPGSLWRRRAQSRRPMASIKSSITAAAGATPSTGSWGDAGGGPSASGAAYNWDSCYSTTGTGSAEWKWTGLARHVRRVHKLVAEYQSDD